MAWRNAQASVALVNEINARWPGRDKSSDGTIGDAAHAARTSDHNPWLQKGGQGIVRARDIDKDGIDAPWLAEYLRQLGARGDRRLAPGGYIIFNRRITVPNFTGWKTYTGSNPHTKHVHVSFSTDGGAAGFDSTAGWGISASAPAAPSAPVAPAAGRPTLRVGSKGEDVRVLQDWSNWYGWRPALPVLAEDGVFGGDTERVVKLMQGQLGVVPDGIVGGQTWGALAKRGFPNKR